MHSCRRILRNVRLIRECNYKKLNNPPNRRKILSQQFFIPREREREEEKRERSAYVMMLVPRLRVFFISRAWETEVHARHATRHYFSLFLSPFEVFVNYHPAAEKRALIIRPVEIADDAALDRVTRLPSGRGKKKKEKKEKKREIKKKKIPLVSRAGR